MPGRIAGIDFGEARIGIAVSDELQNIAFPRETVRAAKKLADTVQRVCQALADDELATVVVGLPLRLDGTEGESARRAKLFGEALREALGMEVEYWDERMTTVAAERSLRDIGVRGAGRRAVVDQSAAALMLQGYLDAHSNPNPYG
jgi:putative Holliday junction resolvase